MKQSMPIILPQADEPLLKLEKELIILLEKYPAIIQQAANEHNPSAIVNYCYDLARTFNSFVTEHRVLKAETEDKKAAPVKTLRDDIQHHCLWYATGGRSGS